MAHSQMSAVAEEFSEKDVIWSHHIHSHETENDECLFSVCFLHFIQFKDPSPGDVSPTVGRPSHPNEPSQGNLHRQAQ